MTIRAKAANPAVLRWARERAGLTVQQVADTLDRHPDDITAWEAGELAPTFRQLEKLARSIYKRPVAVFFFPIPPAEAEITSEFRTMPSSEIQKLEADTRFALRQARAWQLNIPDLMSGVPWPEPNILELVAPASPEGVDGIAAQVREILGVSLTIQQSWGDSEHALKQWRAAVEAVGVFVFKRPFKQKDVSGFCLHDDRYPLIVINNSTAHSRQIFTLFHELAHLLFGISGLTTRFDSFVGRLRGAERAIEVACNRFAAALLVPPGSFPWSSFEELDLDDALISAARRFSVSRHVILRRLLDSGRITVGTYEAKIAQWEHEHLRGSNEGGGGNYYANLGTYLSERYLRAAFHQYHVGSLTIGDLANRFGMKAQSIPRFEEFLLSRDRE
jgi:Zn-dependent peptidase ImmA (M78 family)/transcriptional regulator with XRE-family HTH domain